MLLCCCEGMEVGNVETLWKTMNCGPDTLAKQKTTCTLHDICTYITLNYESFRPLTNDKYTVVVG